MYPEVPMSNETNTLNEEDGSLTGDALVHAVRKDLLQLFGLVRGLDQKVEALDRRVEALDRTVEALDRTVEALDQKVEALDRRIEALDAKVEAILRDTTPMWEVVVSRLDAIVAVQESHGRRLDAIEGKLERLETIEVEIRQLRRRIERMIGELSHDVVEVRAAQHDLEDRLEKIENTPG
jgi:chromosome segregation ATPase